MYGPHCDCLPRLAFRTHRAVANEEVLQQGAERLGTHDRTFRYLDFVLYAASVRLKDTVVQGLVLAVPSLDVLRADVVEDAMMRSP